MTWDSIFILAMAVGALAIKPGAGMMMVMSRTIAQGWSACIAYAAGFSVISILFLLLVIFGYKFFEGVDIVFISILIKSFSALYLIWLGVKGLREAVDDLKISETKAETFYDNFTASLALTLSNPLTIVFYAGILPTILNIKSVTSFDVLIVCIVITVVEFVVAIGYSLPLVLYRKSIKPEFLKGLKYFSSIVIILVGLYIGYTALPAEDLKLVF